MSVRIKNTQRFNTKKSITNSRNKGKSNRLWKLESDNKIYTWSNKIERVNIIRNGVPYQSIEVISERLNTPIKSILKIVGVPQTTYNKKKVEHSLLDSRDSELIILISELIDYGIEVFNEEIDKFQRWLYKPNVSLGGVTPESLLDTITGINEVKHSLNRLEYGNLA